MDDHPPKPSCPSSEGKAGTGDRTRLIGCPLAGGTSTRPSASLSTVLSERSESKHGGEGRVERLSLPQIFQENGLVIKVMLRGVRSNCEKNAILGVTERAKTLVRD